MNKNVFAVGVVLLLGLVPLNLIAQEPEWNPSTVKACDRPCLTGMMDRYTEALTKHDPSGLPLAQDVRFTENTAQVNIGEGILWRAH
jgi:hypothetical protein